MGGQRAPWTPGPFRDYLAHYPRTPDIEALAAPDAGVEFRARWQRSDRPRAGGAIAVMMVRGLFGTWMPGHFARPVAALRAAGFPVAIAGTDATGRMLDNAAAIAGAVRRLEPAQRVVFLAHSKGAIETALMLAADAQVRDRTAGVIAVQPAAGGSKVLDSMLEGRPGATGWGGVRDAVQRAFLRAAGALPGCADITTASLARHRALWTVPLGVPVLAVVSWSSTPTVWVDSFHARLGRLRPGCAHDGQFFVEDQLWPGAEHVLLPEIDHAQAVMGNDGFDAPRLWLTLLAMLLDRVHGVTPVRSRSPAAPSTAPASA